MTPDTVRTYDSIRSERNRLVSDINRGEFWKECPGTCAGYLCCGYQILTPLTGCGMYCTYCVLQVYFSRQCQVRYSNFSDLEKEVRRKIPLFRRPVIRFGTGEFADSLYLEPRLHLCRGIAHLLDPYPNVLVEFKTKSANVGHLGDVRSPQKTVVGFSFNTPRMVKKFERDTAPVQERLRAMRACEDMGFWVSVHFDPMIWYPSWKEEYCRLVDRIFCALKDPSRIAWWSLGGLRTTPALKHYLQRRRRHIPLFSGEMVLGEDGKLRYFRPIRVEFYRAMKERIFSHHPGTTLYLCMESREVWEEAGMMERIAGGLVDCLDRRAMDMLGMADE